MAGFGVGARQRAEREQPRHKAQVGVRFARGDELIDLVELREVSRLPAAPPPPVTDLAQVMGVGVAPGNAQLVVTWTAVDTATGYTVQWTSGGDDYNTGDRQATVTSGSTTTHTIPSLTNGTVYTVQVIATRTGATDGPPSVAMTGTPQGPPPPPPPQKPAQLSVYIAGVTADAEGSIWHTSETEATTITVECADPEAFD